MTSSVTKARPVTTTHTAFVAAPPHVVFRLIAEATRWPFLFPPIVHVDRLEAGGAEDRLRLWAVGNGAVRSWVSRRHLDREGMRIRFRHESPAPPLASMTGEWVFVPLPDNATSVVLLHEFRAVGDDPVNTARIQQAVDRNSTAELAAVKTAAELGDRLPTLVLGLSDTVFIGGPAEPVYEFLYQVQDWAQRLPHVSRVILDEAVPNVQTVEMDTGGFDGSPQTARLVRVCFPGRRIAYKHTELPEQIAAHAGGWYLTPAGDGVRVTAQTTVVVRQPEPGGSLEAVERAGALIRQAVRRDYMTVLLAAKDAVETRQVVIG
jgi:ribosome-associated toxin RatA of RatAB toxin-antitoxin module